jgi:putative N-acetyltransferase (TIGR04045 family)
VTEQIHAPPRAEPATRRRCRVALGATDLERHFEVRRAVFVHEQAIFAGTDRDEHDDDPATIAVIGLVDGRVGGAVRLYPIDGDGLWKGDRLAVMPAHRRGLLGASLVRFAVRTAGELGGTRMVAMVQAPNLHFFEWLGWSADGPARDYRGVPHVPVTIGLTGPRGR